jgi:hypothetical protein
VCEASLDFDESDTGHDSGRGSRAPLRRDRVRGEALGELSRLDRLGARDRSPASSRSAPNAGKSALFNALVGSGRALVSDFAGTTRDALGRSSISATRAFACATRRASPARDRHPDPRCGITKPAGGTPRLQGSSRVRERRGGRARAIR